MPAEELETLTSTQIMLALQKRFGPFVLLHPPLPGGDAGSYNLSTNIMDEAEVCHLLRQVAAKFSTTEAKTRTIRINNEGDQIA